jgi:hypothetical protein
VDVAWALTYSDPVGGLWGVGERAASCDHEDFCGFVCLHLLKHGRNALFIRDINVL